ncbi:hypothetical protein DFP72DRAFT_1094450 [Ephemerocybe angulata]|uniref:Uncharacterized protein n=1 Tax=Ephemerocybe angulata TaxID=980116 RepID=A0A8H6IAJ7_9AGAR|nr:hypothetical protein DFP72DRAFT_1094450 [Tulosesus angulatus]
MELGDIRLNSMDRVTEGIRRRTIRLANQGAAGFEFALLLELTQILEKASKTSRFMPNNPYGARFSVAFTLRCPRPKQPMALAFLLVRFPTTYVSSGVKRFKFVDLSFSFNEEFVHGILFLDRDAEDAFQHISWRASMSDAYHTEIQCEDGDTYPACSWDTPFKLEAAASDARMDTTAKPCKYSLEGGTTLPKRPNKIQVDEGAAHIQHETRIIAVMSTSTVVVHARCPLPPVVVHARQLSFGGLRRCPDVVVKVLKGALTCCCRTLHDVGYHSTVSHRRARIPHSARSRRGHESRISPPIVQATNSSHCDGTRRKEDKAQRAALAQPEHAGSLGDVGCRAFTKYLAPKDDVAGLESRGAATVHVSVNLRSARGSNSPSKTTSRLHVVEQTPRRRAHLELQAVSDVRAQQHPTYLALCNADTQRPRAATTPTGAPPKSPVHSSPGGHTTSRSYQRPEHPRTTPKTHRIHDQHPVTVLRLPDSLPPRRRERRPALVPGRRRKRVSADTSSTTDESLIWRPMLGSTAGGAREVWIAIRVRPPIEHDDDNDSCTTTPRLPVSGAPCWNTVNDSERQGQHRRLTSNAASSRLRRFATMNDDEHPLPILRDDVSGPRHDGNDVQMAYLGILRVAVDDEGGWWRKGGKAGVRHQFTVQSAKRREGNTDLSSLCATTSAGFWMSTTMKNERRAEKRQEGIEEGKWRSGEGVLMPNPSSSSHLIYIPSQAEIASWLPFARGLRFEIASALPGKYSCEHAVLLAVDVLAVFGAEGVFEGLENESEARLEKGRLRESQRGLEFEKGGVECVERMAGSVGDEHTANAAGNAERGLPFTITATRGRAQRQPAGEKLGAMKPHPGLQSTRVINASEPAFCRVVQTHFPRV